MVEKLRNANLNLIQGCGHLAPLEEPDKVNSLIFEWLNKA